MYFQICLRFFEIIATYKNGEKVICNTIFNILCKYNTILECFFGHEYPQTATTESMMMWLEHSA